MIRIPADRAGEFDLVVDVAVQQRGWAAEPRASTRLRIPLQNVMNGRNVSHEVSGVVSAAILEITGKAVHVIPPEEVPDGA